MGEGREGETFPASWKNPALDWPDGQSRKPKRPLAIPSPGGEGQGEGGPSPIYFRTLHQPQFGRQAGVPKKPGRACPGCEIVCENYLAGTALVGVETVDAAGAA